MCHRRGILSAHHTYSDTRLVRGHHGGEAERVEMARVGGKSVVKLPVDRGKRTRTSEKLRQLVRPCASCGFNHQNVISIGIVDDVA